MASIRDKDELISAYEDVRSDATETNWCCMMYDGKEVVLESSGTEFDDLKSKFTADERAYAYLRMETGDDMSKRKKFVFICWIGPNVPALKRAKTSTDKATVKSIFNSFAVDTMIDDLHDFKEDKIKELVIKAGGANYGPGK